MGESRLSYVPDVDLRGATGLNPSGWGAHRPGGIFPDTNRAKSAFPEDNLGTSSKVSPTYFFFDRILRFYKAFYSHSK